MYYAYFNLTENPFSITPDPKYLYMSSQHKEALAHLEYGAEQWGGFIQLTGEVGTGKTTLTRVLLEQLPQDLELALLFNPRQSALEFVRSICDELGIHYETAHRSSLKDLVDALNAHLLENHRQGRRTAVMIDEAQNLEVDVLEQIRLLTNLETTKHKLLMIILVGQPELRVLLARKELRQLSQRITARYHLMPLTLNDTREYIRHRLGVAGCQEALFAPQAVQLIHKAANGVPRLINVLCDRALLGAFTREKRRVDAAIARQAISEIRGELPHAGRRGLATGWLPAAIAAGVVGLAAGLAYTLVTEQPATVAEVNTAAPVQPVVTEAMPQVEQEITALPVQKEVAPEPEPVTTASLAQFLMQADLATDTYTAFRQLFTLWSHDYTQVSGNSGCERASAIGLNCLFSKGTWNNLRELNRPAIIELIDTEQNRHHLVLNRLTDSQVSFLFGEEEYDFPITAVEPFWFGDFLVLWRQPPIDDAVLKSGMAGPSAQWLSRTLNRIEGLNDSDEPQLVFDEHLERRVKAFQRRNRLTADGVVGMQTLIRLTSALDDPDSPTLLQ